MAKFEYNILPCPHCGGKGHLERSSRAFVNGVSQRVAYVYCEDCNARTEKIPLAQFGKTSSSWEASNLAIQSWNRRAYNKTEVDKSADEQFADIGYEMVSDGEESDKRRIYSNSHWVIDCYQEKGQDLILIGPPSDALILRKSLVMACAKLFKEMEDKDE